MALHWPIASNPTQPTADWRHWLKSARPRGATVVLLALLAAHFATRWQQNQALPLDARHLYPRNYSLSLSLVAGHAFHDFPMGDTPGTRAINDFLNLRRPALTPAELQRAFREPCPPEKDPSYQFWDLLATTRVLDLWVAAGLWSLFGTSWSVLFTFYALLSTACAAMIFAISRRLSGSDWAGLASVVLFLASPLESYVGAWSIRDSSPAWFAIACGWLLICVVGRSRTKVANAMSYLALGAMATVGVGWRLDALLWFPFFGLAMIAMLAVRRQRWPKIAAATGLFALGSLAIGLVIATLCPSTKMPPGVGFHMAYYADYTRSNLAGLENSFQVNRCDANTLYAARTVTDHRTSGNHEPVEYLTPRYSAVCRELFLAQARYHAYNWIAAFPGFYWRCLGGLSSADSFFGAPRSSLDSYRFAALQPLYHGLLDPLSNCLPWLMVVGAVAATMRREERWNACCIVVFSLFYAPVLWLVLPEFKHLVPMTLPMAVFGGMGLVAIFRVARPSAWRLAAVRPAAGTFAAWGGALAVAMLVWIAALAIARPIASHERREYITAILDSATRGDNAAELLRGDSVFSLRLAPGEQRGWHGYLLSITAADDPGELVCRHVHYPRDWLWPALLATRHRLEPNRRQYFFVSALQAGQYGDPRPYRLSVEAGRNVRLESCTRVDLNDWQKLPVSMVFADDDHWLGSPAAPAGNSTFSQSIPATLPSTEFDPVARQRQLLAMPWQPTPRPADTTHTLDHLLGRDPATGAWWLAANYGESCLGRIVRELDPQQFGPETQVGDFNGDGAADVVAWNRQTGAIQVAAFAGADYERHDWVTRPDAREENLLVGDFNGDGLDDILIADRNDKHWQAGLSRGNRFQIETWGTCGGQADESQWLVGDFDGDGRSDLVERAGDRLRMWRSTAAALVAEDWQTWNRLNANSRLHPGDFNGDGRLDLITLDARSGDWNAALSAEGGFQFHSFGQWTSTQGWIEICVGDFNADGLDDIAALDAKTGRVRVGRSTGRSFEQRPIGGSPAEFSHLTAGDFNGDGRADLAGTIASSGVIWVAFSEESTFHWQPYGGWLTTVGIDRVKSVNFWQPAAKLRRAR